MFALLSELNCHFGVLLKKLCFALLFFFSLLPSTQKIAAISNVYVLFNVNDMDSPSPKDFLTKLSNFFRSDYNTCSSASGRDRL